jgi:hypothetical protein
MVRAGFGLVALQGLTFLMANGLQNMAQIIPQNIPLRKPPVAGL